MLITQVKGKTVVFFSLGINLFLFVRVYKVMLTIGVCSQINVGKIVIDVCQVSKLIKMLWIFLDCMMCDEFASFLIFVTFFYSSFN